MILSSLQTTKQKLLALAEKPGKKAILTHTKPDADGICAAFALREILLNYSIEVSIVLEEPLSANYPLPDCNEVITLYSKELEYNILFVLDCHEQHRTGSVAPLFDKADRILAIDHHVHSEILPNRDYFIDTSFVSVGAIVYRMFREEIRSFPRGSAQLIASAVYGSIVNDTDNFINANVDRLTFEICAELMQHDIEPGKISESILMNRSAAEMRFTGEVLSTIKTHFDGKVLFFHSSLEMLAKSDLGPEAASKMTRWVKGTKGIELFVFFQEEKGRVRLSLRSKSIDVNRIAVRFGGGGHVKASGCTIEGDLDSVKSQLLAEIAEYFRDR